MSSAAPYLPTKLIQKVQKTITSTIHAAFGSWLQESITHALAMLTEASLAIYNLYVLVVICLRTRK